MPPGTLSGLAAAMPANPAWLVPAVALVAVLLLVRLRRPRVPEVAMRPFLTSNEAEFLRRLEDALPEFRIHAQVAMGALLMPRIPEGGGRRRQALHASIRARYDRKIVDYVLQRRSDGKIAAVVELDDRTHVAERDRKRDAMMARAGYRTIRWQSRRKPDRQAIRATVLGA